MKRTIRRWLPITVALVVLVAGCSHHADMTRPSTQDNFGVQMAKMSLWREALFRFRRAVEINPSDPMAHNNLAVVLMEMGKYEESREELVKALALRRYFEPALSNFKLVQERIRQRGEPQKTGRLPQTKVRVASAEQEANELKQSKDR